MKKISQFNLGKNTNEPRKMSKSAWVVLVAGSLCCFCLFVWETMPETQTNTLTQEIAVVATWPSPAEVATKVMARTKKLAIAEKILERDEREWAMRIPPKDENEGKRLQQQLALELRRDSLEKAKRNYLDYVFADIW